MNKTLNSILGLIFVLCWNGCDCIRQQENDIKNKKYLVLNCIIRGDVYHAPNCSKLYKIQDIETGALLYLCTPKYYYPNEKIEIKRKSVFFEEPALIHELSIIHLPEPPPEWINEWNKKNPFINMEKQQPRPVRSKSSSDDKIEPGKKRNGPAI